MIKWQGLGLRREWTVRIGNYVFDQDNLHMDQFHVRAEKFKRDCACELILPKMAVINEKKC